VPQIAIIRTAQEMSELRSLWQSLCTAGRTTIFQDFHWNLLAFTMFAGREEPWVVCARASYGIAIVPAAIRRGDGTLRLLGEELFDYRCFLYQGEDWVLSCALAELSTLSRRLEVVGFREQDRKTAFDGLSFVPFTSAPQVRCADVTAEEFAAKHTRLGRNLRRLQRLGFVMKSYPRAHPGLLQTIYRRKALQDPSSLFRDSMRIEFMRHAASLNPVAFEVFTLESGPRLGAALVTLRDGDIRRFYTGWYDPNLEKFSPAITLISEVTRVSLAAGLDCDYMTGEQGYKMRLATASKPLYRLCATPQQLAALAARSSASLAC
jgi:CelD/BcsL family acetyltransferase involved in cellulose biosynthesis